MRERRRLPNNEGSDSNPISAHIVYGFSTNVGDRSRVQVSLYFMIVVVTFNVMKLSIMLIVLTTDRNNHLVNMGDAAASFLKPQDPYTDSKSILGKEEFFVAMGMPSLRPTSNAEEARDLKLRVKGTWLPQPQRDFFFINKHGEVIHTML